VKQKSLEGIGFMMMGGVQRFLDEAYSLLWRRNKTRVCGMKQWFYCEDIALEGYDKVHWIYWHM